MTTREALNLAVLASPDDDLTRLVLADYLEESGDSADAIRARFIRRQIAGDDAANVPLTVLVDLEPFIGGRHPHQYATNVSRKGVAEVTYGSATFEYQRGFLHTVRCTLGEWCGGECQECGGYGDGPEAITHCPACDGTHRTFGIGPAVVRSHPVDSVTITSCDPWSAMIGGETVHAYQFSDVLLSAWHVPAFLREHWPTEGDNSTTDGAKAQLSAALIAWAKSQPTSDRISATPVSVDITSG